MKRIEYLTYIRKEVYKSSKSLIFRFYYKYLNCPTNAVYLFRKMQYFFSKEDAYHKLRAIVLQRKLNIRYGIIASPNAKIGIGLRFVHPTSIVIGDRVVAGKNLALYQNTTLGGARIGDAKKGNQPKIGDDVIVFANSLVLGNITVGSGVKIGANSLLRKSVPDGVVCVGSPARIVRE